VRERLVPLSDALANLADWLMGLCVEAGASAVGGDDELDQSSQAQVGMSPGGSEAGTEAGMSPMRSPERATAEPAQAT
jgi:hypothetical protein